MRLAAVIGLFGSAFATAMVAMAASPAGHKSPHSASVVSELSDGVVVRLDAGEVRWTSGGRYVYPSLDGFGVTNAVGRPALPIRIERIAIPPGAVPRLTILESQTEAGVPGTVGPVQDWTPLLPGSSERVPVDAPDPAVYGSGDLFPSEQPVRLGVIGALREQPFVELVFTPVLTRPGNGSSTVYRSVTVKVDFGVVPAFDSTAAEPEFDDVYESSLVNARQGRAFRMRGAGRTPSTVDANNPGGGEPPSTAAESSAPSLPWIGASTLVSSTKYKLTVNRDAIYRLDVSWVTTNAPALLTLGSSKFRIDCLGVQVPITVTDANLDGTFNGSDAIEFYGQKLTWDILSPDDWNSGDFTDDNVYWLYADSPNGLRAPTLSGTPGAFPIPLDFSDTVRHEIDSRFLSQVPLDNIDHWYEEPPLFANGAPFTQAVTISTPGVSTNTPTASIKVRMVGDNYANNLHRSGVLVNGTTVAGPSDWNGFVEFTQGVDDGPANFSQSLLNDGTPETTTVTISLPLGRMAGATPVTRDLVYENWIDVTYGRKFRVDTDVNGDGTVTDDQMLIFSVPNTNTRVHLTGLSSNVAAIYEITGSVAGNSQLSSPVRITNAQVTGASAPFAIDFQFAAAGAGTKRRFIVATTNASTTTGDLVPAAVKTDVPSTLASSSNGVDWLVISKSSLLDPAAGSDWQNLLTRRANVSGLRVKVVDIEDVYDEFSYGIADPEAIRGLVSYAYNNWQRIDPNIPLQYVLLVGDASHDSKNNNGNPTNQNLIFTYMRSVSESSILGYMSDETYFSTVSGGDNLPDLYLGRWPIHTVAETDAVAHKVLGYETAPGGQAWQSDFVFVADDDEQIFEGIQDQQVNDYFPGTPYTYHRVYEGQIKAANPGWPLSQVAAEMRDRIIRQINGNTEPPRDIGPGAAVVSYVGHGSWQNWGSNFSFVQTNTALPDDVDALNNFGKMPLLLIADCLSGGFAVTSKPPGTDFQYALGDDYLATGLKGAIAVLAPSHLTFSNGHATVLNTFFEETLGPKKTRSLGKLTFQIQAAFDDSSDVVTLRSYALLGDPFLSLVLPAPKAPTNIVAVPGNRQVTLTWTASPEASTYNIYQSTTASSGYQLVGNTASTTFIATNLLNCTTYYYAVASVGAAPGFEGPRVPQNTGCGGAGPCLKATPLNPSAPPAPTGVTATDNETGGAVRVQWTANPASEVTNFRVYWGTTQGTYPQFIDAGTATSIVVYGLTNGTTYYFAVSGSNCSHGEGAKSSPGVSAVPRRIEGIKPPNAIDTLRIFRSPDAGDHIDDNRLQWTPPTTNIYGQPTTVVSQEIYSGTTPNFTADVAHRIATVSGTTTQFIHENAFGDAARHYYLIVAIDAAGLRSAMRDELPKGIDTLTVTKSGGSLIFTWPAVTLDVDGHKTLITSYSLYGRSSAFARSAVGPTLLIQANIPNPTVTIPTPAGTTFFYSVVAVDNRGSMSPW